MKLINRRNLLLLLCSLFSITCMIGVSRIGTLKGSVLTYGSFILPVVSLQGIIGALNSLCCILMVMIDFKNGSKIAFGLTGISLVSTIVPIITKHNLSPLPGVVTTFVSFLSIYIIYSFYKKSTINSLTDYITGLPNRRYYVRYVNQQLETKSSFYLAVIEIEDFKNINDVYGIQAGDFILKELAPKLKGVLGKNEMLFKITGGIFAMILDENSFPEEKLRLVIRSEVMTLPPKHGEDPSYCLERYSPPLSQR